LRKRQAIIATSREGGRHATAFLLGLASAFAALGLILTAGRQASAAGDVMIGINMTPGESPAGIATCAAVQPGDTFYADIFISNAQSLVAWELRVDFNPNVVSIQSADYGFFLTQSGGQILGSLFDEEKPGRKFLAASEPSHPDSGSGVLARLQLLAVSAGTSPLTITSAPTVYGPRLTAAGGVPFADYNGDGVFDGALTGGTIDVGNACAPSTPVVTPSPAPITPTPTPAPDGQTPTPAPDGQTPTPARDPSGALPTAPNGGGGGDQAPAPGSEQPTPAPSEFVINAPPSGGPGGANDASGAGSSSQHDTAAASGSSADQTGQGPGSGSQDIAAVQSNSTGGGSSSLILILAAAFAAVAVLVGATFLVMQAYRRR
jgi:hypothetical protein